MLTCMWRLASIRWNNWSTTVLR